MKLVDCKDIFKTEFTKEVYFRQGNRIYFKLVADKKYRLFKKLKNATKAKRFFKNLTLCTPNVVMRNFVLTQISPKIKFKAK